ncbi:uncharacterized protein LOC113351464 [Papaver somniferum]|uniref:uncharacterized protein LOC113351464 n=1 Tax=Papaver somniferum TaxID=3469 RepID=UPI000E6F5615|nr:uncharacterized protein LOC113351464 [Papaver somniferum]
MEAISAMQKPWLAIGDFNAIISLEEKQGGRRPSRRAMMDFFNCLDKCELLQAPKSGLQFSWSNCQQGGCVNIPKPLNVPKKFQKVWLSHPHFMEVVQSCWSEVVTGDPAFVFQSKMKKLKKVLNDRNWSIFGNINVQIKEAEVQVKDAMIMSDANPFDIDILDTLVDAQNKYNSKEVQLNTLLKQKARIRWVKEGASNTIFLHTSLKIRQGRNFISEIEDGNGNILSDQGKIAEVLVKNYEEKFAFHPFSIEDSLLNAIPEVITQEDQDMLDKLPVEEEIRITIFNMDPDSSPGPDGFSGCFYRACWHIIGEDVVHTIQFCWNRKFIPKGLNSNFLFLLPKTEGVRSLNQFRPIGLSNVSYKIFTKIITARLSTLLVKLISLQQAAYVKGRCIQEQIYWIQS